MALKITEQNGTYFAQGMINTTTVKPLKDHLEFLLNAQKSAILNIDKVFKIDTSGLLALYKLYRKAKTYKVEFQITGEGANDIIREFNLLKLD